VMQGFGCSPMLALFGRAKVSQHMPQYFIAALEAAQCRRLEPATEKIAHLNVAGDCYVAGFQSRLSISNLALALTRSMVSKPSLKDP